MDHGRIVCALFAGRPRTWAPCKSRRCRLEWHGWWPRRDYRTDDALLLHTPCPLPLFTAILLLL